MISKLIKILFGGAILTLLACQALAEGKISGITTRPVGDGLQVQIKGEELTAPKIQRVMGGRSFMLEFDASLVNNPQWIRVEQNGLHYVQSVVYQTNPSKIRIFLRVDPNTRLETNANADGFAVKVTPALQPTNPIISAPTHITPAQTTTPVSEKIFQNPSALTGLQGKGHNIPNVPITAYTGASDQRLVSLDFVNTEIVQILKGLALQANVNIVTAPDVSGSLTVSLGNVRVTEALDIVTTLAGLKYTLVGNTFIVAKPHELGIFAKDLNAGNRVVAVTKIIPLYSGEGTHIKGALAPQNPEVQFLLPSEKPNVKPVEGTEADTDKNSSSLTNAGAAGQAQSGGSGSNGTGATAPKDAYLVLVGPSDKVTHVKEQVEDADEQMCRVLGIDYPRTAAMITAIYHPKGLPAATLLGAVCMSQSSNTVSQSSSGSGGTGSGSGSSGLTHARVGTVDLYATPLNSVSAQAISLSGRETEVNRLMAAMESIDTLSLQGYGDFAVYDVKFADPRALRQDLLAQFPGLSVTIPAASAGNPNAFKGDTLEQASERTSTANGPGAGSKEGNASSASGPVQLTADNGQAQGLGLPYAAMESNGVPMKLLLRGSQEQIHNAMAYLTAIDLAPRQVALECRVMELSKEDAVRIGLDWSILTGGTVNTLRFNQGTGDSIDVPGNAHANLKFPGGGSLDILNTLDQLAGTNHMIARPNVLAIDGRQTEIFVGDVIRYIQSIQTTQNGITITTAELPVGVRLAVLPRVGSDGNITMDLRPTVSQLNGFTPVPGGGELPQTSLRIAQSTMLIHDNETIAIGGLIQDQDVKSRSGIPILKDLPILGYLFSRTNNDHKRTEVVFFLTAHVVDGNRANAANPTNIHPH